MSQACDLSDFLRLSDQSRPLLDRLLADAARSHAAIGQVTQEQWCAGQRVGFIWDGEGFRNRAAFELGVAEAGGVGVQIPGRLGEGEAIEDLAAYLDNWFDVLVVRTPSFARLGELADAAMAPVINARTYQNHPCEILGDLAFIQQVRGGIDGLTVVFVGEATNLLHSWCEAATVAELRVVQICPPGREIDRSWLASLSPDLPARVNVGRCVNEAIASADVIYTDCWPSAETPDETHAIAQAFAPLQITASVLTQASPDALFLPCPPVTRGEEVSSDAMNDPRCRVVEAKQWLLYAQNALLAYMIDPER